MGTGDGRFVVRTAADDPGALVVGVDPNVAGLGAGFTAARRQKLENALFVVASAESLPPELLGVGDEVHVQFPWAALLRAVVGAQPTVASNLAALLRPGGTLEVVLSVVPRDGLDELRELDDRAATALAHRFAAAATPALDVDTVAPVEPAEARRLHSTWARRLGVGRNRPAFRLTFGRAAATPP